MKIAYKHLLDHISPQVSIDDLSDKLFQLGHEHEIQAVSYTHLRAHET